MRASEFEFHHRFWFIFLTYGVGFGLYSIDHVNAAEALVRYALTTSGPHLNSLSARHALQALFGLAATLVAAAAWMRTWGNAYLRSEVVHDTKVHTERLVADGPFRHVRNPLYLGNIVMAVGLAMMASRTGAAVLIAGNVLIVLRLIGREEAALAETQGDAYRGYLAAVPKLWPSLRPRLPSGGLQPGWLQAFWSEGWVWIFTLYSFVFAWTLNGRLYSTLMWSTAAIYFPLRTVADRWRRRHSPAHPPKVESQQSN